MRTFFDDPATDGMRSLLRRGGRIVIGERLPMGTLDYRRPDEEEDRREQLRRVENWIGIIALLVLILSCLVCGVLGTFFGKLQFGPGGP